MFCDSLAKRLQRCSKSRWTTRVVNFIANYQERKISPLLKKKRNNFFFFFIKVQDVSNLSVSNVREFNGRTVGGIKNRILQNRVTIFSITYVCFIDYFHFIENYQRVDGLIWNEFPRSLLAVLWGRFICKERGRRQTGKRVAFEF